MEKVYVALLLLVAACLFNENAASSRRRAKMGPIWGKQPSPVRNPNGSGTFAIKGTAGNRNRFREEGEKTSALSASSKPTAAACTAAGFFPSPGTCTEFYRCVDWTGSGSFFSIFHFNCPAGTVFDDALDVCNHGWAAGRPECGGTAAAGADGDGLDSAPTESITTTTTTTTPTTTIAAETTPAVVEPEPSAQAPPGVFSLVCYADNKYRRHPLYCNKYYYCIYDGDVWNVPSFTCPEGLVFDEANQICTRQGETDLSCKLAPYEKPKESVVIPTDAPKVTDSTPAQTEAPLTDVVTVQDTTIPVAVTEPPVDTTTVKTWEVDPTSIFHCPAPGYYPFEGDCIRFYKCVETDQSKLKGLLYRCPEGYGYHEGRQRCLKNADLPVCERVTQPSHLGLRYDNATPVYPEDLLWFFNN